MGTNLAKRLDGNDAEFLRDVEYWGQYEALTMWADRLDGYHSIEGLRKFLTDKTGNPDFGISPKVNLYGGVDAFDKFVVALRKHFAKVESLEIENRNLREENERIKQTLKMKAFQDNQRVIQLMESI